MENQNSHQNTKIHIFHFNEYTRDTEYCRLYGICYQSHTMNLMHKNHHEKGVIPHSMLMIHELWWSFQLNYCLYIFDIHAPAQLVTHVQTYDETEYNFLHIINHLCTIVLYISDEDAMNDRDDDDLRYHKLNLLTAPFRN